MDGLETFDHFGSESFEELSVETAKKLDDVVGYLEWSGFKVKKSGAKDEAEVDVDETAVFQVDQDVSIVSILYLQHVTHQRISCQRVAQVDRGLLEAHLLRAFARVLGKVGLIKLQKVSVASHDLLHLLFQVINGQRLRYEFNNSTVFTRR